MVEKVLITGFEPFGGDSVNPSWEAVSRLPDVIGGKAIKKLRIPVVFGNAAEAAWSKAMECGVDAIISVGVAGARSAVTPEMVAINLRHGGIADNAGHVYRDEPSVNGAPAAYFSTLPVRRMAEVAKAEGIPSSVSYSAGAYVCNDTMFTLLHKAAMHKAKGGKDISVGFVHVPNMSEQEKANAPSLPLDTIVRALEIIISEI